MVCAWVAWSPWLMLTRKASAPARSSAPIISGERLAGPSVASIFTFRPRGSSLAKRYSLLLQAHAYGKMARKNQGDPE